MPKRSPAEFKNGMVIGRYGVFIVGETEPVCNSDFYEVAEKSAFRLVRESRRLDFEVFIVDRREHTTVRRISGRDYVLGRPNFELKRPKDKS